MDVINIVATVVSVASLILVIHQSINLQKTINSQIYQNFVANSLEIDRILIDRPYLRPYIYGKAEVNEHTENLDQIMSLVELVVDITENIEVYEKYIPRSRRIGWLQFVHDVKSTSAYNYYINEYGAWYKES